MGCFYQCCGSGSGMGKKSGSGSGMNEPDHISESLETIFGVKIIKFFDADPGSGMEKTFRIGNTASYLGMIPGSVKDVLSRLERTKTKRTADTTGIAGK